MQIDPPVEIAGRSRRIAGGGRDGVALVIILAFVVLLTGLIVAFFTRSVLDRRISNSSAGQAKVSAFADGAANAIIAELDEEIMLSSSAVPLTSGTLYIPLTPAAMLPQLSGTSGITSLAPNLLKISGAGQFFYSGANGNIPTSGPSNVLAVSSTIPSLNGRYITPARWNSHYLLPLLSSTDATPQPSSFTPPSWVLVARDGSNPVPASVTSGMTATGTNPIIGRYAFAIYHEGGLLDANVAGYPSTTSTSQSAYKTALSYADLTQLGLTQSQVDQLVSWRNATAIQPAGTFSSPNPPASSGTGYYNFVTSNTTGFLTVGGTADRMFASRQELIKFVQNGLGVSGTGLDVLNYLTHFSRGLEQPSYVPVSSRPVIVGSSVPPGSSNNTAYQGNNTYWGGDNAINLTGSGGMLSVRVSGTFTRSDGSIAVVGEPLVKRKFALSRLQQITTNATATASNSNPIYAEFGLSRSSSVNTPWIYKHGATTSSSNSAILTLSKVAALNPPREPDLAELLKAAIAVGSVGKSADCGQNGNNGQYLAEVSGDLQILQIMADLIDQQKSDNYPTWIQYVDSNTPPVTHNIYGVQNLPYFYRWHYFGVTTAIPSPLLSSTDTVPMAITSTSPPTSGTTYYTVETMNHTRALGTTTLQSGTAAYMIIPEVWNPHDSNTLPASGGGPTNFRVVAETTDPTGTLGYWGTYAVPGSNGNPPTFDGAGSVTQADPPSSTWSTPTPLTLNNGFLEFTDNSGGGAFREPTLLWRNTSNITLTGTSVKEDPSLTGNTYYGILIGMTPVSWIGVVPTVSATANGTITTGTYILQSSNLCEGPNVGSVPNAQGPTGCFNSFYTFLMQYQDSSGNWITYESSFFQGNLPDIGNFTLFVNPADYTGGTQYKYKNPLMAGVNSAASGTALTAANGSLYDPRTARFSAPVTIGSFTTDDTTVNGNPTLDAVTQVSGSNPSPAQNLAVASSNFVVMKTQRPATSIGEWWEYTTPTLGLNWQMGWYSSQSWTWYGNGLNPAPASTIDALFYEGLLSQNNPALQIYCAYGGAPARGEYYEDPDSVARRAMGAYATISGTAPYGPRDTNMTVTGIAGAASIGLPMFTSGTNVSAGVVTPSTQSQSRPIILHRPFRSVAEMSYAFRGTPWKNIDFFTPESGDTALLDTFCVNEPPSNPLVAGKVNLNTQQAPVLQAVLAGAYRDELPTNNLPPLSATEAGNIANLLKGITGSNLAWRGPLMNVGDLVGHYIPNVTGPLTGSDYYQSPVWTSSPPSGAGTGATLTLTGTNTYAGFSAALSGTLGNGSDLWATTPSNNNLSSTNIQRFRESAIRPLAECGQTRVWNLMIDVIAQSGRYPQGASNLAGGFLVEGEKRYWIHIAIDRLTGQVIDRQVEAVPN